MLEFFIFGLIYVLQIQRWVCGPLYGKFDPLVIHLQCTGNLCTDILHGSRDSSVGIATRLRAGRPRFDSRQGQEIFFLISVTSRPALEPTQPPIEWVSRVKLPEREADHSSLCSAEVKNGGAIPPFPYKISWRCN